MLSFYVGLAILLLSLFSRPSLLHYEPIFTFFKTIFNAGYPNLYYLLSVKR